MKRTHILVIGSIFLDLLFHGVPKLAEYGESIDCDDYVYLPGGKGANQAIAIARMGGFSHMVGCLGNDSNGHLLRRKLEEFGVDVRNVPLDPNASSGLALMLIDKHTGQYVSYHVMGANEGIHAGQIEQALDQEEYCMILIQLEMPLDVVYCTCEMASRRGIPVFLDAGPAMNIPLERLKGLFILSPNEAETKALTGIFPDTLERIESAASFLYKQAAPQYVLLKLGERGAYLYDGSKGVLVPAFHALPAVDSTAAGDTFGGAFAVAYCQGIPLEDSVLFANAAAAICVSRPGGQPSIPSLDEVLSFLSSQGITSISNGGLFR